MGLRVAFERKPAVVPTAAKLFIRFNCPLKTLVEMPGNGTNMMDKLLIFVIHHSVYA
jgi:hypothetical protein